MKPCSLTTRLALGHVTGVAMVAMWSFKVSEIRYSLLHGHDGYAFTGYDH